MTLVKFKKAKNASGYQIRAYRVNKNTKKAKLAKTVKTKKTTATAKGLKVDTEYVIRVRAYRTVKGKTIYGKEEEMKDSVYTALDAVMPGKSKHTGAALKKDYVKWRNAFVKHSWKAGYRYDRPCRDYVVTYGWNGFVSDLNRAFTHLTEDTGDMYDMYKSGKGGPKAMAEIYADCIRSQGVKALVLSYEERDKYQVSVWARTRIKGKKGWYPCPYGIITYDCDKEFIMYLVGPNGAIRTSCYGVMPGDPDALKSALQ